MRASADAGRVTMRAVVQQGQGSADVLQVTQIPIPEVADDRVLVRVRAASINAADYHTIHGIAGAGIVGKLLKAGPDVPVRGIDVAGVVERVGKNVTTLKPGDGVFGCGRGTWAEYASAPVHGLVAKPADLTFAEAGAVGVASLTALQGVRDHGRVGAGDEVLVYGAGGGVGTFAVQIAKALGARVTAVTSRRNVDVVAALDADEVVDASREDVLRRRGRYDAVIDVAAVRSIGSLLRALAPGGRLVLIGAAKRGGAPMLFGRVLAGMGRARVLKQPLVFFVAKTRQSDLLFIRELIASGKVRPVIDRTYPLDEVREAVRYTLTGQARAKVVLTLD